MHRLPTRYSVWRFRISSWLYVAKILLVVTGTGFLGYGMIRFEIQHALISAAVFFGALVVGLLQWAMSTTALCPLCLAQPIGSGTCSKHRSAGRFLGSHRLKVAGSVIFSGYFRCPYCGEFTAVRTRHES